MKAGMKGERARVKNGARKEIGKAVSLNGNGHAIGIVEHVSETPLYEDQEDGSLGSDPKLWRPEASDEDPINTSDSETIL